MKIESVYIERDYEGLIEDPDLEFKGIYCHAAQDLKRNLYLNNPLFVCKIEGKVEGYAIIEKYSFNRGAVWFGPIVKQEIYLENILVELIACLKRNGISSVYFYPLNGLIAETLNQLVQKKSIYVIGSDSGMVTAVKKLSGLAAEHDLLQSYTSDLRRSLKKAIANEVKIRFITNLEDFEKLIVVFLNLYDSKNISINKDSAKRTLMEEFNYIKQTGNGCILAANYQGEIVGGLIQIYTRNVGMYIHAASDKQIKIPIMHLIVHHGMMEAQSKGLQYYDMGAIAADETNKEWKGFTFFKMSFGCEKSIYPMAVCVSNNRLHKVRFQIIEKLLELMRILLRRKKQTREFSFDLN